MKYLLIKYTNTLNIYVEYFIHILIVPKLRSLNGLSVYKTLKIVVFVNYNL